jgi:tRNA-splicing ligase RtcB (3'-phosphate/5'-hydroxy nucleic acid ligase)
VEIIAESEYRFVIPRHGRMRVPGVVFATRALIPDPAADRALEQVVNVAELPGIVEASYAMPDVHWGYGFPIGGVAATDVARGGVISPGGVGFDIACGVRLVASDLSRGELLPVLGRVMDRLAAVIPCGAGPGGLWKLRGRAELEKLLVGGAGYAVAAPSGTWTGARITASPKAPTRRRSAAAPWTAGCTRWTAWDRGTISWKSRRWTRFSTRWRRPGSGWARARSAS